MTGFGQASFSRPGWHGTVEIRALNHRHFELRSRLPQRCSGLSQELEDRLRPRLHRGRVELTLRLQGSAEAALRFDRSRAKLAYAELEALAKELGAESTPISLLALVPQLFSADENPNLSEEEAAELWQAIERACDELCAMRVREGQNLSGDFLASLAMLEEYAAAIERELPKILERYRQKLRERIAPLLAAKELPLDSSRLEHEVVLFAERSNVAEEITRLRSHCHQFREMMQSKERTLGRKLEFLLQEIHREVNTLGAKSSDLEAGKRILEMKTAIDTMKEQIQNVL